MRTSDSLKCPICHSCYGKYSHNTPRLLPDCGHTLCNNCLYQILKSKPSKCPLDDKAINKKYQNPSNFPSNTVLMQIIEERLEKNYEACILHQELKSLYCMVDKVKICPSCVNGKDDAVHYGHETKLLSEIKSQVAEKRTQLESDQDKIDDDREEILKLIEEKKDEALGLKKRKFDAIRSFVDEKENEALAELGLLFAQKKTKTEEQFAKDETLKEQIRVCLSTLNENKLDESFFKALKKSGIKRKEFYEKENQELDNLTRKLEDDLILADGSMMNKSLTTIFQQNMPKMEKIVLQEFETPSKPPKTTDAQTAILSQINALIKVRRKGELLEVLSIGGDRNKENLKNSLSTLSALEGIKKVKLNLKKDELSEEVLYAIGYLWKSLKEMSDLSLELGNNCNSEEDYVVFFEHAIWEHDKIESFNLGSIVTHKSWDDQVTSLIFSKIANMINLKSLTLSFNTVREISPTMAAFAYKVIPALKNVEILNLDFSLSDLNDDDMRIICMKMEGALQKIKSFGITLKNTELSVEGLAVLAKDGLSNFKALEKLEFIITDFFFDDDDYGEEDIEDFWHELKNVVRNLKYFSADFSWNEISDFFIQSFARHVLPAMSKLESFHMEFIECKKRISSLAMEYIYKGLLSRLADLREFKLIIAGNELTDSGVTILTRDMLPKMPKLESLELFIDFNQEISDKSVIELWKNMTPIMQNLKYFGFSFVYTKITQKCFEYFCQSILPKMSALTTLKIEPHRQYSARAHEHLFLGLKSLGSHLENLELSLIRCEHITDQSLSVFLEQVLPYLTALRSLKLNVSGTGIQQPSFESICLNLPKLPNLEDIDIKYRYIFSRSFDLKPLEDRYPGIEIDEEGISYTFK